MIKNITGITYFRIVLLSVLVLLGVPCSLAHAATASFIKTDTTTQGDWKGIYGAHGYNIPNDAVSMPYTQTGGGTGTYIWANPSTERRALLRATTGRLAVTWQHSGSILEISINVTDGQAHNLAVYMVDWDTYLGGRAQRIDLLDATTRQVLATSPTISHFTQGVYAIWRISGHVILRVTNTSPTPGNNAVVSGLFFDAPAPSTAPIIPTITNIIPTQGQVVSGSVITVEAKIKSASWIDNVRFTFDGGVPAANAFRGIQYPDGSYRFYSEFTSLSIGPHTLVIRAANNAGLVGTATVSFTIPDTTPPTVSSIAPTNQQVISGTGFVFSARVTDKSAISSVQFLIDGSALILDTTRGSGSTATTYYRTTSFDTTTLANGRHTLDVRAVDAAGNVRVQALPYFYTSNPVPPLPSYCTVSPTQIMCSAELLSSLAHGVIGYKGWQPCAMINLFTGPASQRALSWNRTTRTWSDPGGMATKVQIASVNAGYLTSAPTAPLFLLWTPPRPTLSGTVIGDYRFSDNNTTCGQTVTVSMMSSGTPSSTLRTIPIANGATSVISNYSYTLGVRKALLFSMIPASTSNPACDQVRVSRINLRFTAPNQAPVITKIEPGPADVQAVNELGFGIGKRIDFDVLVEDEQPASLTYTCRIDGVAVASGQCVPTTPQGAIRRFRLFVPASTYTPGVVTAQRTITITATDSAGLPAPAAAQWALRVNAICGNGRIETGEACDIATNQYCNATCTSLLACGNGQIDAGEQCDPASSQSCSSTCQWNPQVDRSMDCTRYDNLATDSLWNAGNAPIPTSGGVRTVYDTYSWTGNTTAIPAHYAIRCQATFTVPAPGGHYLFIKGAGGNLRIAIDEAVLHAPTNPWASINGNTKTIAEILPRRPLTPGTHTLNLIYNLYQDASTGVRPQWFSVSWMGVPQRQWIGVEIRPTTNGQPPSIDYVSSTYRQTSGSTTGALMWNWLTDQAPFTAFYAGTFDFPQVARYEGYSTITGGDLQFTDYYQEASGIWGKDTVYRSTSNSQWAVSAAGPRTLLAEFNYESQGLAQFNAGWRLAPVSSRCGNGKRDPGEDCDPGTGPPSSSCNAFCEVPPGTPPPTSACDSDSIVEGSEMCAPPNTATCDASCRPRNSSSTCVLNNVCDANETPSSCPGDCGANTAGARAINNHPEYSDLTLASPRIASKFFYMEGPAPGCNAALVITKMDLTTDPRNPLAQDQTITVNGSGASAGMEQVRCNMAGVQTVRSSEPSDGSMTEYSVCIGCRSHSPANYLPGNVARVYVPANSYASVRFRYKKPGVRHGRYKVGIKYPAGGGGGAAGGSISVGGINGSLPLAILDESVEMSRPVVVTDTSVEGGGAGEAGGIGAGEDPIAVIGGWDRKPRYALLPDNTFASMSVDEYWLWVDPSLTASSSGCHFPSSYNQPRGPANICINPMAGNPRRTSFETLLRGTLNSYLSEASLPEAEVKIGTEDIVLAEYDGKERTFIDPPSNVRAGLQYVDPDNPYVYYFIDYVNSRGDELPSPLTVADAANFRIKEIRIAFEQPPGKGPLAAMYFQSHNTYDPPPFVRVLRVDSICPDPNNRFSSTCKSILEWVADAVTYDHGEQPDLFDFRNGLGISGNVLAAALGFRLTPDTTISITSGGMVELVMGRRWTKEDEEVFQFHNQSWKP